MRTLDFTFRRESEYQYLLLKTASSDTENAQPEEIRGNSPKPCKHQNMVNENYPIVFRSLSKDGPFLYGYLAAVTALLYFVLVHMAFMFTVMDRKYRAVEIHAQSTQIDPYGTSKTGCGRSGKR
ncbi:hypothetical protein [Chelatococcus asaccharovorans]|uniref:hypothetical protein n=1 Tax=Chelatococcus asaccharovorans TaxID=28210 RepID=UPI0022654883|nr:hypothetical protein [Chelatococcus asaccharovorans]